MAPVILSGQGFTDVLDKVAGVVADVGVVVVCIAGLAFLVVGFVVDVVLVVVVVFVDVGVVVVGIAVLVSVAVVVGVVVVVVVCLVVGVGIVDVVVLGVVVITGSENIKLYHYIAKSSTDIGWMNGTRDWLAT